MSIIISGEDESPQWIYSKEEKGEIRKVFHRVYTDDMETPIEEWTWKMRFSLIGKLIPGGVISHRSADDPLSNNKVIFITWDKRSRNLDWPGLTISCLKGPPPHERDMKTMGIYMSGPERRLLENLQPSRRSKEWGGLTRTIGSRAIEIELRKILSEDGEDELNALRDRAKSVAKDLGMEDQMKKLDSIISALLSTGSDEILENAASIEFARSLYYDEARLSKFMELSMHLGRNLHHYKSLPSVQESDPGSIFSFFEAYFSNYIEGTTFEVEEAEEIIFRGKDIPLRSEDSHDIRGTFEVINDEYQKSYVPTSSDDFVDLLKERHKKVLKSRPQKNPGVFKAKKNRAGNSRFVLPNLVEGTLIKGFEVYEGLPPGFPRATFMMFLVSEVHPFDDGNGRISRIMMNAELSNQNQSRIIITTSMRGDYLRNLKALTNSDRIEGFPKMLHHAQIFSSQIPRSSLEEALSFFNARESFDEESP